MFKRLFGFPMILIFVFTLESCSQPVNESSQGMQSLPVMHFSNLVGGSQTQKNDALSYIENNWENSFVVMSIEILYLSQEREVVNRLFQIMIEKTGKNFSADFDQWYEWIWNEEENLIGDYSDFKAHLYKRIDPRFEKYFKGRCESRIRLDEVRWGGVIQDGIPPLRSPKMLAAEEATYLADENIVFGIEVNGDVRAYPKRILAWHEMFVDNVGGISVCGVYCTLCGTVILYNTEVSGKNYELGTSGFLYRSNKLMYDKETQSLWNTVWGEPVLGPLKDKGIRLEYMSVITTTWGEWKRRHPDTKVLSLETGHKRNYGEGVAYQQYFATDELMFTVPFEDRRLKNKAEVLALRIPEFPDEQLAISTDFLLKKPVFQERIGSKEFVVFTDPTGGNRVFESKGIQFKSFDGDRTIVDRTGRKWSLYEDRIQDENGNRLERLPYHRAFWFGWHAAYPDTRLIK